MDQDVALEKADNFFALGVAETMYRRAGIIQT
jgi:hypothetical protein